MTNEINNLQPELEQPEIETEQPQTEQPQTEQPQTEEPKQDNPPVDPNALVKVPTTGRDMLFAMFFLVGSIIWADFGLFGGFQLGHSIAAVILGVLTVIYPLAEHKLSRWGAVYSVSAIVLSTSYFIYNSVLAKTLMFFWSLILMGLAIINNTHMAKPGWKQIFQALRQILITPFERVGNTMASLFQSKGDDSKKKAKGILIGLLCALPGLCIIIPILCQSDAAFEAVIKNIFSDGLARVIHSILLGVLIAMFVFTAVFAAVKKIVHLPSPYAVEPIKFERVSSTPVTAFLTTISSVYVIYLFSQLAYFFSAFSGLLPTDYTTAQYARRGFIEMTVICAINVVLIALPLLICKKDENGRHPLAIRLICAFLCLFSLIIVSTVIGKLVMYMQNYGLTQKRVYTSLFCVATAIVIIFVGIRLFVDRFPYFRAAVTTLAAMSVFIAFADVNTTVARYNTEAYLSGYLYEVDVEYLEKLDDAAVPYLIKLVECEDEDVAGRAAGVLYRYASRYGKVERDSQLINVNGVYTSQQNNEYKFAPHKHSDFRAYNLQQARAQKLISDNWETIIDVFDN